MKFILQEDKFILTEDTKFILEERFRLNEDTLLEAGATVAHLVETTKELQAILPNLLKELPVGLDLKIPDDISLTADKATTETQIKTDCQVIQDLLINEKNFKDTLDKVQAKAKIKDPKNNFSKEELIQLEPLCKLIVVGIRSATQLLRQTQQKPAELATTIMKLTKTLPELKSNLEKFHGLFEKGVEVGEAEKTTRDEDTPTAYTYKLTKSSITLKVGDTYQPTDLIEITPTPTEEIEMSFKIDNPKVATVSKAKKVHAVAEGKTLLRITVADKTFNCICNVEAADPETKIKTTDTTDWKTKLASAVNKDTVIEEFIYTTWPQKAKEVIKIKDALLQECEHYGFLSTGDQRNPFISFISNVYLNPVYNMRTQTYNIIHNLVAHNVLKGEDLTMNGVMRKGNLVYCKALYALDDGAIKLYITKQNNLLNAVKKPEIFSSNAEMTFNLLYSVEQIQTGKATRDATDLKLRSMAQIEQLEQKWTGEVSKTTEKDRKNTVTNNAELLKNIDSTELAIDVLVAIATKFSSNEKIGNAIRACKEAQERLTKATTVVEVQKLVASVERRFNIEHIKADQALKLVKSILESDQFSLTLE